MKVEESILGYPVTTESREDCLSRIICWVEEGSRQKYFVCANPHSLEVARTDPAFDEVLRSADLIIPDGVGIELASKILGGSIRSRVTGSDIFLGLSEKLNKGKSYSYFFLGSTDENLGRIREKMEQEYPNIAIAGTYSPPFKVEFSEKENSMMLDAVNSVKPDVLWIGMTAPKQEKWILKNKDRLDVKCIGAIGAVFDFYTGKVKRSHQAFQRMGLEWLPRLLREPGRLWRRNVVSNPLFLLRVISARFRRG